MKRLQPLPTKSTPRPRCTGWDSGFGYYANGALAGELRRLNLCIGMEEMLYPGPPVSQGVKGEACDLPL